MKSKYYLQPGINHPLTPSASEVNATVSADCSIVRVATDADINLVINGTADANDLLVPAGTMEYFRVPPGATVSVFGTATVSVTEMM